jgi:hypothetical protein
MQLHIKYLLSMEDSARTRAACVKYLQRYLVRFVPNRVDLANEFLECAASLGGRLHPPHLSWKYTSVERLFGLSTAKEIQARYNLMKSSILRAWDRLLWVNGL